MSRLKSIRWACVPAWLTEFCSDSELVVDFAAVAGSVISYSFFRGSPITPNYQSLWDCITVKEEFSDTSVVYLKGILKDLVALGVLFEVEGGKLMPGPVAMLHESASAAETFWEPVINFQAVDELIKASFDDSTR